MKNGIRYAAAIGASLSLIALTGCDGLSNGGSGDGDNDVEDVPTLADIEDSMWDSMEESESVTMTADMEQIAAQDPEGAAMFQEMLGSENMDFQFSGSLQESATSLKIGDEEFMRIFGSDGVYMSSDAIFGILGAASSELSSEEQEVLDEISGEVSGTWIDFSEEMQGDEDLEEMDLSVMLTEFRDGWDEGSSDDGDEEDSDSEDSDSEDADSDEGDAEESSSDDSESGDSGSGISVDEFKDAEGSLDERDGVDVWVYAEGDDELVVEADHDSPRMLSADDGEVSVTFSDWDETDAPEKPEDSDLLTEEDLNEIAGGSGIDGSELDPGALEPEEGLAPEDDEADTDSDSDSDLGSGSEQDADSDSDSNTDSDSDTDSGSSDTVNVPGVGTVDCSGPIPGDPGFTDPNGNYTDEEIQAVQDACDGSGSGSSEESGDSTLNLGTVDCSGPVPGDPGFSDPNNNYTDEEIQAFQDACADSDSDGSGSGSADSSGSNSEDLDVEDSDGPVPGDPGFSDPNNNYSDEEIEDFQQNR